jgi:hypothetical protein
MTNDSRVIQLMLSKTKFLSVSPAMKLRSVPGFPHISPWEMYHARPALHTVFSNKQLDHLIELLEFRLSWFCRYLHNIFVLNAEWYNRTEWNNDNS